MLKEELEKQLGTEVSNGFYEVANRLYEQGSYKNNREFCAELNSNELLTVVLEELKMYRETLEVIFFKVNRISKIVKTIL